MIPAGPFLKILTTGDMPMTDERVIWEAEFNDSVTTYWLLNGVLICVVTIVGILFLPIWFLIGKWITRKYLASHRCTLTNRSLKVNKGILTKIEKTVPLDRITDLGIIQGPIMRYFDIEALSVETAGQSSSTSLVQLAGIVDGRKFRDAVLKQRDLVVGSDEERRAKAQGEAGLVAGDVVVSLLRDMAGSLQRIEKSFSQR